MKTLIQLWQWIWGTTPLKDKLMPHGLSELVNIVRRENGKNLEATPTDVLKSTVTRLRKHDLIEFLIHINKPIVILGRLEEEKYISSTEDYLAYNFLVSYILSAWEKK